MAQIYQDRHSTLTAQAFSTKYSLPLQSQRVLDLKSNFFLIAFSRAGSIWQNINLGCFVSSIWLKALDTQSLCFWGPIFCRSCYDMQTWPHIFLPQWLAKHHYWVTFRDLSWCDQWPPLQPLTGEIIGPNSYNEDRADIHAGGRS